MLMEFAEENWYPALFIVSANTLLLNIALTPFCASSKLPVIPTTYVLFPFFRVIFRVIFHHEIEIIRMILS